MSKAIDSSNLLAAAKHWSAVAKNLPQKEKQFLRKEGTKLQKKTKAQAKQATRSAGRLKVKTGNYVASIKRGKVYDYQGRMAVRVYSYAPHGHLIEDGHRMVLHDGTEVGFVPGFHVFEIAGKAFSPEYLTDIDDFLDKTVEDL